MAVERDPALASRLRRRFARADVAVVERDLLDLPLPQRNYRVVASIPFSITTCLLGRLLDPAQSSLERAALVVAWGAAMKVCDPRPADPRVLWWNARYGLRIARRVAAKSFSPPPKVDAAVLVVTRREPPLVPPRDQAVFARLLAQALETRRAPASEALAPIFSNRQLRRLAYDLRIDPHAPIARLRIEQWAGINATMVALVEPVRWPRRKPRWSSAPTASARPRASKHPPRRRS